MTTDAHSDRSALARYQSVALFVLAVVAAGAAFLWAFSGRDGGSNADPSATDNLGPIDSHRPAVGEPAPDFALVSIADRSSVVKLSDFRGTPVVLNWFASWCGPCRAEIPEYQAAQDALGDRIVFLAVNLAESPDTAAGFLQSLGATFPALLDSDGSVADHYRLQGMPTSIFIDGEGVVQAIWTGRVLGSQLSEELDKLGLVLEDA